MNLVKIPYFVTSNNMNINQSDEIAPSSKYRTPFRPYTGGEAESVSGVN